MSNQPPFAEYPRPGQGSIPAYGRGPGVYFDAIGEGWNLVMKDIGHWIAATVVYFVIAYGLSLPITFLTQSMMVNARGDMSHMFGVMGLQMALNLIPTAVTSVLMVGMMSMAVRKLRGEYINVGMMFEPFRKFGTIFGSNLLFYVIVFVSAFLCVLPAFFFGPVLLLMPLVAYQKDVNPIDSLSLTFDRCKGHWAGLLGLSILMALIVMVGFCACFVGSLITWPLYCMVFAIHYRAFFESDASVAPYPA